MKTCLECGMPMEKAEDFAGADLTSEVCVHCGREGACAGEMDQKALHEHIKRHLMEEKGLSEAEAEKAIRKWDEEHPDR